MKHSRNQRSQARRVMWSLFTIGMLWLPTRSFAGDTNNPTAAVAYPSFKIISQRNIFDPNRRAGSGERGRRIDPNRLARAEGFSLVGTLIDKRGEFAFFSGSDSKYKKVLKVAGTIADYKVTEVAPDHVQLETKGNQIKMAVGMQMKKLDAGEWQLVDGTVALAKPSETTDAASASETKDTETSDSGPSTGSSSADAILKKLMQQREKELNK
ncbi:MAG TPA: hypothetical protein VNL17_15970 [Verrucomicrobiae bacterium]|nr:hypothetical protein [Verrucomicrobiae bacterium]